jgi:hypothetical protein
MVAAAASLWADLARDAGTVRIMGEEGRWAMESALQMEKEADGKTWTVETAVGYTPAPRVQLLLEPTFWERSEPVDGPAVGGMGDTDFTVAFLAIPEDGPWPAVVAAGKVKIPTARSPEIGTGKADGAVAVILGKEFGELEVSLELEYETFGSPETEDAAAPAEEDGAGGDAVAPQETAHLKDQFIYTLTADYGLTEHLSVYVELFGNTAPTEDEGDSNAAGIGLEYDVALGEHTNPLLAMSVDTDERVTAKIGVEWNW